LVLRHKHFRCKGGGHSSSSKSKSLRKKHMGREKVEKKGKDRNAGSAHGEKETTHSKSKREGTIPQKTQNSPNWTPLHTWEKGGKRRILHLLYPIWKEEPFLYSIREINPCPTIRGKRAELSVGRVKRRGVLLHGFEKHIPQIALKKTDNRDKEGRPEKRKHSSRLEGNRMRGLSFLRNAGRSNAW